MSLFEGVLLSHLSVVSDVVAQADETRLELLGVQPPGAALVEVVERLAELVHLLVTDTLRVTRQDLK